MVVVLDDPSGIAQGLETAGAALAAGLERRAERRLMQQERQRQEALQQQQQQSKLKGMELISNWASTYDNTKSPMENIGVLQQALQSSNVDASAIQPILQDVLSKKTLNFTCTCMKKFCLKKWGPHVGLFCF